MDLKKNADKSRPKTALVYKTLTQLSGLRQNRHPVAL
jgi:hypothetical protein